MDSFPNEKDSQRYLVEVVQPFTADRGHSGANPSILPTLGGESETHVQCATPSAMRSATLKNSQGQQLENANYTGTKLKQRENR